MLEVNGLLPGASIAAVFTKCNHGAGPGGERKEKKIKRVKLSASLWFRLRCPCSWESKRYEHDSLSILRMQNQLMSTRVSPHNLFQWACGVNFSFQTSAKGEGMGWDQRGAHKERFFPVFRSEPPTSLEGGLWPKCSSLDLTSFWLCLLRFTERRRQRGQM